jgi:hypothetical protein
MSPLQSCLGKQPLFTVRTIRNTQTHSVGRMQSFGMLKRAVHIVTVELQRFRRIIMVPFSDQIFDLMMLQRAGWRIGKALDLHAMSARFEPRPRHRLS